MRPFAFCYLLIVSHRILWPTGVNCILSLRAWLDFVWFSARPGRQRHECYAIEKKTLMALHMLTGSYWPSSGLPNPVIRELADFWAREEKWKYVGSAYFIKQCCLSHVSNLLSAHWADLIVESWKESEHYVCWNSSKTLTVVDDWPSKLEKKWKGKTHIAVNSRRRCPVPCSRRIFEKNCRETQKTGWFVRLFSIQNSGND